MFLEFFSFAYYMEPYAMLVLHYYKTRPTTVIFSIHHTHGMSVIQATVQIEWLTKDGIE